MKLYLSITQTLSPWPWWSDAVQHVNHEMTRDGAHDWAHLLRVYQLARKIWLEEFNAATHCSPQGQASWQILATAALFHDVVNLPKDSPLRAQASRLAGEHATRWLAQHTQMNDHTLTSVAHAIHAHSFSANINAESIEAQILSDADKLDALGAIGIARTFAVGGALGRALSHEEDPLGTGTRDHDDSLYGVDHFYCKLFKLKDKMYTQTAQNIAAQRESFMRDFLNQFAHEMNISH